MIDEDPTEEDIACFGGDTAFCPDCGGEISDEAEICPLCYAYLGGQTSSRHPVQAWFGRRWFLFLIILVLISFFILMISGFGGIR